MAVLRHVDFTLFLAFWDAVVVSLSNFLPEHLTLVFIFYSSDILCRDVISWRRFCFLGDFAFVHTLDGLSSPCYTYYLSAGSL